MPTPAYKISKAALNMLMVQYSLDYADQGFTVFVISPGVGFVTRMRDFVDADT